MSVELDPVELGFRRPFTQEVTNTLRLRNPNSDPVAFKVKTTAPKQYCVRPNSGRIDPGEIVEVLVLLQAMKEDPPLDAKCRDKFLVQSVAVKADQEFNNVAAVWSSIEQTAKSSIQEKKIRVNFLPSDESAATPSRNSTSHTDAPPAYSSPMSAAATPAQQSTEPHVGPTSTSASRGSDSNEIKDEAGQTASQSALGIAAGGISAAAVGVASSIPSSQGIKSGLQSAQSRAADLGGQAVEGVRQRKPAEAVQGQISGMTTTMQDITPAGVPVPLVAALCLLSFIIAYLFF